MRGLIENLFHVVDLSRALFQDFAFFSAKECFNNTINAIDIYFGQPSKLPTEFLSITA